MLATEIVRDHQALQLIGDDEITAGALVVSRKQQMSVRNDKRARVPVRRKRAEIDMGVGKRIRPTRRKFAGVIQLATK